MKKSICVKGGVFALALMASFPAQSQNAARHCFSDQELIAEQTVRYGLFLRESSALCSKVPWDFQLSSLWETIDTKLKASFVNATRVRERAFRREFGNNAVNRLELWDARIVYHYRYMSPSEEFCTGVRQNLEAVNKGGRREFVRRAALFKGPVTLDFQGCR